MAGKKGRSGRPQGRVTPITKGVMARLEPKDIERLKRAAKINERSVSNYLAMLIKDHLDNVIQE